MQQLRDKLVVAERAAKSEAQMKVSSIFLCYFKILILLQKVPSQFLD